MQNHNSVNTSGFVPLDGGWDLGFWQCGNCGCANSGCDTCTACGWYWNGCNRCNNGRVQGNASAAKTTETAANVRCSATACSAAACDTCERRYDCPYRQTSSGCDACPAENRTQSVQSCPANTYLRDLSCDSCQTASSASCNTCQNTRNTGCNTCQNASSTGCNACSACNVRNSCSSSNACSTCNACSTASSCPVNRTATAAEQARNRAVGMVYAAKQAIDQVYTSESALRSGTLFPELHKPMNGCCPGDCNCSTQDQQSSFALWELRLYLDTHPDDAQAQALFRRLCQEKSDPNYATAFLPDEALQNGWDWTQDPWPWQCGPCGE